VTWDGENEGKDTVNIAKPYKLRVSLTTVKELGVTYNFTYDAGSDPNNPTRTKTAAGSPPEQELVTPVWTVNDEITAIASQTTVKDEDGNPINLIMIGDSRQWAATT
jgi:hypothetical protein